MGKLKCTPQMKEKLEYHLKSIDPDSAKEVAAPEPKPASAPKPAFRSEIKKEFLRSQDLGYGAGGSKQGQMPQSYKHPVNGGEAVIDVPINQPGGKGATIMPIMISPPHSPRSEASDKEEETEEQKKEKERKEEEEWKKRLAFMNKDK